MQNQLEGSGFIKLRAHGPDSKKPAEKWREQQYSRAELQEWVNGGNNIGYACGVMDICVLDVDAPDLVEALGITFDEDSYIVRTGSGGFHIYFKIHEAKKVIIHDKAGTHLGELQCLGQYVVVPPSIHPNGTPYRLLTPDAEIPTRTMEEVLGRFRGKCKLSDEREKVKYEWRQTGSLDDPFSRVRVDDVWDAKVTEESATQLFCEHPVHGSSTKTNLVINPGKNTWWCGRCNSGGGPALAVAVKYGIIECSDARAGALRGDKYKEVLQVAREHGITKEPESLYQYTKKELEFDDDS